MEAVEALEETLADSRGDLAPAVMDAGKALVETMVDSRGGVAPDVVQHWKRPRWTLAGGGLQLGWMHVFTMTPRCSSGEHRLIVTQATLRPS